MDNQRSASELWDLAASRLREQLSAGVWATWFGGVRAGDLTERQFTLLVPNRVACERIRTSYGSLLDEAVSAAAGLPLDVELLVDTAARPTNSVVVPNSSAASGGTNTEVQSSSAVQPADVRADDPSSWDAGLNPRYTFDEFVIGASNRFAHAAALSVAEAPARSYNPLFIYGAAGLGKTHLLHAIGHHVRAMFPRKRVRYVSTENLMNEFVDALRTNNTPGFKRRYREIDVLLIDDIQFLERSQQLQEEFFHTFNSLHNSEGQIVISSDRAPKAIATLEDRLRTRFEWGLITDVQPPEFETRLAILRKKAEQERLTGVPPEVLAFIASNIKDNVRELEGALIRVAAYSSLNRAPLSEEVAQRVLSDLLPASRPRTITPELILDETAKMFGWTVEDLIGKSRRRPLVTSRQICMYVFRELTDYSYPRIAEVFGGRDHTTVMHAVDKIKSQMTERHQIFDQVNDLIGRIKLGSA
ncbi:MAG: chromosomal replication initiator protein DnaA [Acidimicrobiia bacterium]